MNWINSIVNAIITIGGVFSAFLVMAKFEFKYNPLRWLMGKFEDIMSKFENIDNKFENIENKMKENEENQKERFSSMEDKMKKNEANQEERFKNIESKLDSHSQEILRLIICNEDIPIRERIKAGDKYIKLNGNGEISVIYNNLLKEFGKEYEKAERIH